MQLVVLLFLVSSKLIADVTVNQLIESFITQEKAHAEITNLSNIAGVEINSKNIEVVFTSNLDASIAGRCRSRNGKGVSVYLNTQSWGWLSDLGRELLLFHELGHCILRRKHRDETIQVGQILIPASIMNHEAFDENIYKEFKQYFLEELFRFKE